MEKEFVTYEQALALKELGFDEDCFFVMIDKSGELYNHSDYRDYPEQQEVEISAPLKQQVFRWFREKYEFIGWVEFNIEFGFMYVIDMNYTLKHRPFNTYEEAENACIDKLIEIAKQQEDGK